MPIWGVWGVANARSTVGPRAPSKGVGQTCGTRPPAPRWPRWARGSARRRAQAGRTSSCPWTDSSITAARSDQASLVHAGAAIRRRGCLEGRDRRIASTSPPHPAGHQRPIAIAMEEAAIETDCAISQPGPPHRRRKPWSDVAVDAGEKLADGGLEALQLMTETRPCRGVADTGRPGRGEPAASRATSTS